MIQKVLGRRPRARRRRPHLVGLGHRRPLGDARRSRRRALRRAASHATLDHGDVGPPRPPPRGGRPRDPPRQEVQHADVRRLRVLARTRRRRTRRRRTRPPTSSRGSSARRSRLNAALKKALPEPESRLGADRAHRRTHEKLAALLHLALGGAPGRRGRTRDGGAATLARVCSFFVAIVASHALADARQVRRLRLVLRGPCRCPQVLCPVAVGQIELHAKNVIGAGAPAYVRRARHPPRGGAVRGQDQDRVRRRPARRSWRKTRERRRPRRPPKLPTLPRSPPNRARVAPDLCRSDPRQLYARC